jgi:tetratricopeptide (TPR) repeat protein
VKDVSFYKKAWKVSNKTFARAQRSLGRVYFYGGNYPKSIKAFQKATNINKFHSDTWFTMGCAYMKLNDLKNAANSFSTVVSIDE